MGKSNPTGKSLITYLEWRAENTPDEPCFQQPNEDFSRITTYTYSQVLCIVDNLASWIIRTVGDCEPLTALAFLGTADPRYVLVPLAARKANCVALYLGLQNSLEANNHLCKETAARAVLYVDGVDDSALPTDDDRKAYCVPEIDELLNMKESTPLPKVDHEHGTFICLHSSGSTGLPKPIEVTSECLQVALLRRDLDDCDGFPVQDSTFCDASTLYFGIPIYHMSGFVVGTKYALYYGTTVMYMPKDRQPGAELMLEAIAKTDVDTTLCPPGLCESLVKLDGWQEKVKRFKYIASGGGMLPREACTTINEVIPVLPVYGSTEVTDFEPIVHGKPREDWEYFHISPNYNSIEWRQGEDSEFYELVIKRDPKISHLQGVFFNFPEKEEWATGDLFSRHSSKENYWRYESRADDQISYSNASTLNPLPIEERFVANENIEHAMIVGDGRPFPVVVLQPTQKAFETYKSEAELREKMWEVVTEVNKFARANGQIASQRHIIITDESEPLVQTAKTTVSKKAAVEQYSEKIEEVYTNATDEDHRDLSKRIDD